MGTPAEASVELVRLAKGGDRAALERLFQRHYERVRQVVRARLGPSLRSHLESGDILQETFLAAIEDFEGYEPRSEASFLAWLARLATHRLADAARHRGRAKRSAHLEQAFEGVRTGLASGELRLEPAAPGPGPRTIFDEAESRAVLEEELARLCEDQREVLLLRHWIGATWAEAAAELGLATERAARVLYAKAQVELGLALRGRGSG